MRSATVVGAGSEVTAELAAVLARFTALAEPVVMGDAGGAEGDVVDGVGDADRVDQIALLEQIKAAAVAVQQTLMVRFARSQVEAQIADGTLDPKAVGRGIGDQIGLACRVSPVTGSRRLEAARSLHTDLPGIRGLLAAGQLGEDTAALVVSETRHLESELRRRVDTQLCAAGVHELSAHRAAVLARTLAYRADPEGYVKRGRTARSDRRVTLRPAPDTMSLLTGFLPVEQGVACLAALRSHTDARLAAGDDRGRGQIMADTLVERLTGQGRAEDVNVEVGIVVPVNALLDPQSAASAQVVGQGPIPAGIARDLLASTEGRRWWRRLFTTPGGGLGGKVVGGESRRRCFDGFLAQLIATRDGGRCRDKFCDAPIRHIDHIRPHRAGGPTSFTNGRGSCARGNYVREMPGWTVELVHDGLGDQPHTVRTTTPTGHTYTSRAGPAP